MRRKYIIGTLVGLLLGFVAQLFVDFFIMRFPNSAGQADRTIYQVMCDYDVTSTSPTGMKVPTDPKLRSQWRLLIYQGVFLLFMCERGETALRTASITGLLGAFSVFAANRFRANRKASREATVT